MRDKYSKDFPVQYFRTMGLANLSKNIASVSFNLLNISVRILVVVSRSDKKHLPAVFLSLAINLYFFEVTLNTILFYARPVYYDKENTERWNSWDFENT